MNRRLMVVIVLLIAAALGFFVASHQYDGGASEAASPEKPQKQTSLAFHDDMRMLWEEHLNWTRSVIVGVAADLPDLDESVERLLQNQTDIGDAFKPYYGDDQGNALTDLLRTHILIAAEILVAAKAGDTPAFDDAVERWYENGDEIAAFLNGINPRNWPLDEMQQMFKAHLDVTLEEAADYLGGDFAGSIDAYGRAEVQILGMADMLSGGIMRQFPQAFRGAPIR